MNSTSIAVRAATSVDLDAANRVIEAAVMTWNLPERVKRLSLESYLYSGDDLEQMRILVANDPVQGVVGVGAWEPADTRDTPEGQAALLLHGIYVLPGRQGAGIGSRLLRAALEAAAAQGVAGLLIKAQSEAGGFFERRGFERLPVLNPKRDYPHRFWKPAG